MESEADNSNTTLQCPTCRNRLNVNHSVDRLEEQCPVCRSDLRVAIFPRFFVEKNEIDSARLAMDDEAVCSFYPELKAEKVCDECGCMMSSRASVKWGDHDYCLPCLHRLREEEKETSFVARANLYDNRALALVTLMAPFSFFTAPAALFLLLRHRKGNQSFVPRSRTRWWIAFLLAIGWIIAWGILMVVWVSLMLEEFS